MQILGRSICLVLKPCLNTWLQIDSEAIWLSVRFVQATVAYLGKVVGQGEVRPVRAKVVAIDAFPLPSTK